MGIFNKKKKKLDRRVTWSKEFHTYEERSPDSFDDHDEFECNQDTTFDDGDVSLIADYLIDKDVEDDINTQDKRKSDKVSSVFTTLEDDSSLIDSMDDRYSSGIGRAASDDASIVSLEKNHDDSKQREVDGNFGHLGLVLPSLKSMFWSELATQSYDTSACMSNPTQSEDSSGVIKRTTSSSSSSSTSNGSNGDDTSVSVSMTNPTQSYDTSACMTNPTQSEDSSGVIKRTTSSSSSSSTSNGSNGDEYRTVDEDKEEEVFKLKPVQEEITLESLKKKKKSMFGFMSKRKSSKRGKKMLLERSMKKSSQKSKQDSMFDKSEKEVKGPVNLDLAECRDENEETENGAVETAAIGSIIADGSNEAKENMQHSENPIMEKSNIERSLKSRFSFGKKGSKNPTPLSKKKVREIIEFAIVQHEQHVVSVDDHEEEGNDELREDTSEDFVSENIGNQESEEGKYNTPEREKNQTAPFVKKEETDATEEENEAAEENVIVNFSSTNFFGRDHLYNDILRGGSFDSVSTTEDILTELRSIEDAALKMYQSMVLERDE